MGLDMYIYNYTTDKQVAYWRKANAIHNWFDRHVEGGVENCAEYLLNKEILTALLEDCKFVVDNAVVEVGDILTGKWFDREGIHYDYTKGKVITNVETIGSVLPTQSGFFWGSTEYDENYLSQVKYTISVLERLLEEVDFDKEDIVYSADW